MGEGKVVNKEIEGEVDGHYNEGAIMGKKQDVCRIIGLREERHELEEKVVRLIDARIQGRMGKPVQNTLYSVLLLELLENHRWECCSFLRPSSRVLLLETVEDPGEHIVQFC